MYLKTLWFFNLRQSGPSTLYHLTRPFIVIWLFYFCEGTFRKGIVIHYPRLFCVGFQERVKRETSTETELETDQNPVELKTSWPCAILQPVSDPSSSRGLDHEETVVVCLLVLVSFPPTSYPSPPLLLRHPRSFKVNKGKGSFLN